MDPQLRYAWPALVTLGAIGLYAVAVFNVGRARDKYKIAAPAVAGHPVFERHFRIQMNTLEQLVGFLPALWLYAWYGSPAWAAVLGGIWIVGRIAYLVTYARDPRQRGAGFALAAGAAALLWMGAAGHVVGMLIGARIPW